MRSRTPAQAGTLSMLAILAAAGLLAPQAATPQDSPILWTHDAGG